VSQSFHHNHTMLTLPTGTWFPRTFTFGVWALAAASAVFWGLRWDGKAAVAPPPALTTVSVPTVDSAVVARLLGGVGAAQVATVSAPSRFVLAGVVARTASHTGAALIAIDGKPAKAFSVGSRVEEGLYLQSVQGRRASLSNSPDAPSSITLELPAPSPAPIASPGLALPALLQSAMTPAPSLAPSVAQPPRAGRRVRPAGTDDTQD
jgi:general secretion pathway protein C